MEFSRTIRGTDGLPHKRTLTIDAPELLAEGQRILALVEPTRQLMYCLMEKFAREYLGKEPPRSARRIFARFIPFIEEIRDQICEPVQCSLILAHDRLSIGAAQA